jgi:putative cell wall-binding protein
MVDESSGQAGGTAPTTTTTAPGQTTTTTAPANTDPVERLSGDDRLATSVAISQATWAPGEAQAAVLARSDAFPDALGGTPLAAERGGPLLLTPSNALDGRIDAEIRRATPAGATIYLLGGPAAISETIADTLRNEGFNPVRIAGANRFATAVAIASQGLGYPPIAVLVTGTDFPDALSAGAASQVIGNTGPEAGPAARPAAVLLTSGPTMPPETAQWLSAHPPAKRYAIGGAAAAADPGATRIAGQDRYETAKLVAEQFFPSPAIVAVASGTSFADALSGGAHALKFGAPLLLTAPTALPQSTQAYLTARKDNITKAVVYGGLAAVSSGVANSIVTAIT